MKLIYPDGTELSIPKKPTLEQLQLYVEGYVESIPLPDGRMMIANEDGNQLGLRLNRSASALAGRVIVGTVVIGTFNEFN